MYFTPLSSYIGWVILYNVKQAYIALLCGTPFTQLSKSCTLNLVIITKNIGRAICHHGPTLALAEVFG